jgi:hypothetical protein
MINLEELKPKNNTAVREKNRSSRQMLEKAQFCSKLLISSGYLTNACNCIYFKYWWDNRHEGTWLVSKLKTVLGVQPRKRFLLKGFFQTVDEFQPNDLWPVSDDD